MLEITVEYEIVDDESGEVESTTTKTFKSTVEKLRWEQSQQGHPWLHLREVKRTTFTG